MDIKAATALNVPFVINDCLKKWKILDCQEEDWCNIFSNKVLTFRKGRYGYKNSPRWESTCETLEMKLKDFFENSKAQSNEWLYYDYKTIGTVFKEEGDLIESVRWSDLGFPEMSGSESTLWIGNQGAHTPCHLDSYGYNLVAQLYGRKLWILVAPEDTINMCPSRVPYEESSIYSDRDFYTPNAETFGNLVNVYKVILEAGQVLFVPRHWWHYVENLEVAISVNTWIPIEEDNESRVEEALIQRFVWGICQDLTEEEAKQILNPNELSMLTAELNNGVLLEVAFRCLKYRSEQKPTSKREHPPNLNSAICLVNPMSVDEKIEYVDDKAEKHNYDPNVKHNGENLPMDKVSVSKILINSFCHPDTIAIVKEIFLKQLDSE